MEYLSNGLLASVLNRPSYTPVYGPVYVPGLTDRSQPIWSSTCSTYPVLGLLSRSSRCRVCLSTIYYQMQHLTHPQRRESLLSSREVGRLEPVITWPSMHGRSFLWLPSTRMVPDDWFHAMVLWSRPNTSTFVRAFHYGLNFVCININSFLANNVAEQRTFFRI